MKDNNAKKYDGGKLKYSYTPIRGLNAVAKVMTMGGEKYGAHNWRSGDKEFILRLFDAANRHLNLYFADMQQDVDAESGLSHLAHVACNALMIMELMEYNKLSSKDVFDHGN